MITAVAVDGRINACGAARAGLGWAVADARIDAYARKRKRKCRWASRAWAWLGGVEALALALAHYGFLDDRTLDMECVCGTALN